MPNTQKPEPSVQDTTGGKLDLHSVFLTLQGEGPFSGRRAVFVRLAGCQIQCPGCDTEYTQGRKYVTIEELAETIKTVGLCQGNVMPMVVITGGEPLRQSIGPLVLLLVQVGIAVQIESNGAIAPDQKLVTALKFYGEKVTLVVSPKTKNIHAQCYQLAGAFKYVLDHRSVGEDGLPGIALGHERGKGVARPRPGAPVYITPCDLGEGEGGAMHNQLNREAVAASCIKYGYIAGLQIHKMMAVA